jgi:hypothetical protein
MVIIYQPVCVTCPTCNVEVGSYSEIGGKIWLQVGILRVSILHGECRNCHSPFHWVASEKRLERLIERCSRRKPHLDIPTA